MQFSTLSALAAIVLPALVSAQLSGSVGPLTSRESKATKICSVLDYGGEASKTSDIGPALTSAFAACKTGGTVYVPPGDYGMTTWVALSGGSAWALKLDGIIYRVDGGDGNMIMIEHTTDFEMYSSTSAGAIQGYGYEYHKDSTYGPRLLRFYEAKNFSIHDIALVDAPAFHFSMDTCESGEVYNMIIRGGDEGGLDGIDVWGTNIWIHDVEVTNKDECITVKNPSDHFLIEDIYCNSSGGCGMGSLGADTAISNIIYNNVYTYGSNQMYMIKSNGGSGTVSDCQFNNFIGRSNAYSLDINAAWTQASKAAGDGVIYENLSFNNWKGTCESATTRGPINLLCSSTAPCTNITITDFAIGADSGSTGKYVCQNAYGSGGCLKADTDSPSAYTTTQSWSAMPTGYEASTMAQDLATPFAVSVSIPIPTVPTSFFPGRTPVSALMANGGGSSTSASASHGAITTSSKVAVATSTAVASSSKVAATSTKASSSAVVATSKASSSAAAVSTSKTTLVTQKSSSTLATSVKPATTTAASSSGSVPLYGNCTGGKSCSADGGPSGEVSSTETASSVAPVATDAGGEEDDECEV